MNGAHIHLITNHLPIIIPIVGAVIFIAGYIFKSSVIKRTAMGVLLLGSIATFPAFNSGEEAEEIVEHIPGSSHDLIHEHEEIAESFAIMSYGLGLLSILGLWASWKEKKFASWLYALIFASSIVVIYFAQQTGSSGGEIRHPEIVEKVNLADLNEQNEEHGED